MDDMQGEEEELGDDLTPAQLRELRNVIKMNHAKQKADEQAPSEALMSASEMKRL